MKIALLYYDEISEFEVVLADGNIITAQAQGHM